MTDKPLPYHIGAAETRRVGSKPRPTIQELPKVRKAGEPIPKAHIWVKPGIFTQEIHAGLARDLIKMAWRRNSTTAIMNALTAPSDRGNRRGLSKRIFLRSTALCSPSCA